MKRYLFFLFPFLFAVPSYCMDSNRPEVTVVGGGALYALSHKENLAICLDLLTFDQQDRLELDTSIIIKSLKRIKPQFSLYEQGYIAPLIGMLESYQKLNA